MTDLNELADRCERATGPDPALDEAIQAAITGAEIEWQDYKQANAYHRDGRWINIGSILAYTASLDAAMTLVPDGQDWYVTAIRPLKGTFAGAVYRGIHPKIDYAEAATPALALTAAALRARAATPVQVNEVVGS